MASFTVLGLMYDAWVDKRFSPGLSLLPPEVRDDRYCTQDEKRVANARPSLARIGRAKVARPNTSPRIHLLGNRGCAILFSAIGWTKLENADAI